MADRPEIAFDRTISDTLFKSLHSGTLHALIERRSADPLRLDVQLRRDSKSYGKSWVSLYLGLTCILNVHERDGAFRLDAHSTHRAAGEFDDRWNADMSSGELASTWPRVEKYLDRVVKSIPARHFDKEGKVHAAMCSGNAKTYRVIDRESEPSFPSTSARDAIFGAISKPIRQRLDSAKRSEPWWPRSRSTSKAGGFGKAPDILGVDAAGRLLIIEAKPPAALDGITRGPAQVAVYGLIWAHLLEQAPATLGILQEMLRQRVELGLSPNDAPPAFGKKTPVVPVLAIGAGHASYEAIHRACEVQHALEGVSGSGRIGKPEIWVLDAQGDVSLVLRS